jgi:quinol monooxygenase YgiN
VGYLVTARWVANDGEEDTIREALRKMVEPSRAEPGCLYYQPSQDPEDGRNFLIAEVYSDEDAYKAHMETPHFKAIAGEAIPLLAARERGFYRTID